MSEAEFLRQLNWEAGDNEHDEHDEEFARADGELFERMAGEFAMDEQTARVALRDMTGRKASDLRWGSGANAALHGNLQVGDDPAPASAGVGQAELVLSRRCRGHRRCRGREKQP